MDTVDLLGELFTFSFLSLSFSLQGLQKFQNTNAYSHKALFKAQPSNPTVVGTFPSRGPVLSMFLTDSRLNPVCTPHLCQSVLFSSGGRAHISRHDEGQHPSCRGFLRGLFGRRVVLACLAGLRRRREPAVAGGCPGPGLS